MTVRERAWNAALGDFAILVALFDEDRIAGKIQARQIPSEIFVSVPLESGGRFSSR
jgi:hypothetical protein